MTVEKVFYSEDYAKGFAEGLEYAEDGPVGSVEVKRRDTGRAVEWVVSFQDDGLDDGDEDTFDTGKCGCGRPLSTDEHDRSVCPVCGIVAF